MKKGLLALLLCLFTLPVMAKNSILIVGDSISAGYGIDIKRGWAALLQEKLNEEKYDYQVVNASISGDTTSNGLIRLPKALADHQPKITIIELGGNDGLRGLQLNIIKKNLRRMIELSKNAGSEVLLLGFRLPPNYGPEFTQQFNQMYVDLAEEENISVVPVMLQGVDENPDLMQADGIHPTEAAQPKMLTTVWPFLKPLLSHRQRS